MSFDSKKIKADPHHVFFGSDVKQVEVITCVADIESSLDGKCFFFHTPSGAKHFIHLKEADSVAAVPAFTGWTAHEVEFDEDDSSIAIATKIAVVAAALNTVFASAVATDNEVKFTQKDFGYCNQMRDAMATAKQTGFAFALIEAGQTEERLGSLEGDIELSGLTKQMFEIKTHQTGGTVQAEIITGYDKPTVGYTMYETHKEAIKRILQWAGQRVIISELAGATEGIGYGLANIGGSNPKYRMRLHPVAKDFADKSFDKTFWAVTANLEGLTFSGENPSTIPITATVYPDETKKGAEFFYIGNPADLLTA